MVAILPHTRRHARTKVVQATRTGPANRVLRPQRWRSGLDYLISRIYTDGWSRPKTKAPRLTFFGKARRQTSRSLLGTDSTEMRDVSSDRRPSSSNARDGDPESDFASDDDLDVASRNGSGKRKRPISVSCELCKQRKVKCDRGQPICGWCSRNDALCEYKERRKPGLRAGYGRELEQRLDKLEGILRSHSEILQASYLSPNSTLSSAQQRPHDDGNTAHQPSDRGHAPQLESSMPGGRSIQLDMPLALSVDQSFPSQVANLVPSASSQLSALQSSAPAQSYYDANFNNQVDAQPLLTSMPQTAGKIRLDEDMPPYDLVYALVDLFFKHINPWCPILHRKTTLDSLFGPSNLQETDRILLHAMVATSMRYSDDVRLTEERRLHYHQISKQKVLLFGMETSTVKSLQALVILALDICGSSNGPPGWNIMALITRSVVQLGLAVETTSISVSPRFASIYTLRAMILADPNDFIEDETRRRLFWVVYMLDRYATIATAFDFALSDKEIDRTLPCRDDLWMNNQKVETRWFKPRNDTSLGDPPYDQPENIGAFGFHCEILQILGHIHNFLKQPVDIGAVSDVEQWQLRYKELDNMLTSYKFSLPSEYGNMPTLSNPGGKNLSCSWVMLHATYHFAVIRLHSSAAYPTTRSPIFTPSYSASQRCHGAVENLAALCGFVSNSGLLPKLGPPFAFTLWVAARLLLVHGSTVEHEVSPQIKFFVDTLREMGRHWPVAARYRKLLQRVLDEYRESEQQGDGVTPSSVKILADMRRTAFDLDFLISRQPRVGSLNTTQLPSVTPARTPASNELEYLDVFNFFNVPRLPLPGDSSGNMNQTPAPSSELDPGYQEQGLMQSQEPLTGFNITNFLVDEDSDWLFKPESGKFMAQG